MIDIFASIKAGVLSLKETVLSLIQGQRQIESAVQELTVRIGQLEQILEGHKEWARQTQQELNEKRLSVLNLAGLNPHFKRDFLPNDDSALQKVLIATWSFQGRQRLINHLDLMENGFRVFSQNDEDGILLRLFTHIGVTNRCVIEIGSNCSGSDIGIPENLSANLIVNHGWHGVIVEKDPTECSRMRYFFARDFATRHYHWFKGDENYYYSPVIVEQTIGPENINEFLDAANCPHEPDLLTIDIDGGDYSVIENLRSYRPRVLVVEFEKRFRDRHCVVQPDRADFGRRWAQSGSTSLSAWEKLFAARDYVLSCISAGGFNAFFVRSDVAEGRLQPLAVAEAFDRHAIFSTLGEDFWLKPDETWQRV